jgi:hypothetical protein
MLEFPVANASHIGLIGIEVGMISHDPLANKPQANGNPGPLLREL